MTSNDDALTVSLKVSTSVSLSIFRVKFTNIGLVKSGVCIRHCSPSSSATTELLFMSYTVMLVIMMYVSLREVASSLRYFRAFKSVKPNMMVTTGPSSSIELDSYGATLVKV